MKEEGNKLIVRRIRNGTVIDHIPGGQALNVLKILGITGEEDYTVALLMNVRSRKIGRKDIVKIENRELDPKEVDKIALLAPEATINTIRDYSVMKKTKVKLPNVIKEIVTCTNPNCITNVQGEPVTPTFKVVSSEPLVLCCEYCGTYISRNDIVEQYSRSAAKR